MSAITPLTAYLFECKNDPGLLAVSLREDGRNIPPSTVCYAGWRLRGAVDLESDRQALGIDLRHVSNRVRSVGYYIWRNGAR